MASLPTAGPERPRASFPTSRSYLAMAVAFIAFAVYGSLLPFEGRRLDFQTAWEQFGSTLLFSPTGRISRSDLLANVLLFVPIGFFLAAARLVDRRGWTPLALSALVVLPVSAAVSGAAEFLQMFTADRFPSGLDILAQSFGAVVGMVVWWVTGQDLTNWIREALAAAPHDRPARLFAAAAAAWVFVNLAPFDVTIDMGDLAARVRDGRISVVPFGHDLSWPRRAWDVMAETTSAVPLGLLGVTVMQLRRRRRWPGAFLFGAAIVVLVECMQIFIKSHSADTGDALLGSAGVAIGAWAGTRLVRAGAGTSPVMRPGDTSWLAVTMVAFWCMVLGTYHWLPYDFAVDYEAIRLKVTGISMLPFAGYLRGSYLNAFNDLLTKLALAAPLGFAASFVTRDRRLAFISVTAAWLLVAAGVFGVLEAGQFFLPSRSPDPTDVLVGVAGTFAGLRAGRWVRPAPGNPADAGDEPG